MTTTAPLTGSEKQITWAEDIRTRFLARIDTAIADQAERGSDTASLAILRDTIAAHTSAKTIIDRRNDYTSMTYNSPAWSTMTREAKDQALDAVAMLTDFGY